MEMPAALPRIRWSGQPILAVRRSIVETFIAQLINGLATGGIYALLVLGMNLLLLVRSIVHQGFTNVVVMNMAVGFITFEATGNVAIAVLAIFLSGVIITVASEPLFRPLSKRGADLETIVLSMGIGIILTEIISQYVNKGQVMSFPKEMRFGDIEFTSGVINFSLANVLALVCCVAVALIIVWFLFKTAEGRAIRAMAQNLRVAKMLGVPFGRTGLLGFGIAGLLSAIIAIICIMSFGYANAELAETMAVKVVVLMLFAGMGDIKGGILSAIFMGVVEAMALAYLPGRWTEAIFYGVIMLAIIWRPNGLFSRRPQH